MNFSAAAPPHPLMQFWLAYARWLLVGPLLMGYWVSGWLPPESGWENHWIENLQLLVLIGGLVLAAIAYRRATPGSEMLRLALFAMPIWALCAAREISWGAAIVTAGTVTADGPSFTSRDLWFRPAIVPLAVATLAFSACVFLRYRLDRPLLRLMRRRQFPWMELGLFVAAAVLSAAAENHVGGLRMHLVASARQVMEEWSETLAYLSLLTAQMRIFHTLSNSPAAPPAPGRR